MLGRSLGLSEDRVIEALVVAIRVAGPARGGRFVGPDHLVADDVTSRAAIESIRAAARRSPSPES